jgi:amino acid adenylation domain-containing protein
MSDDLYVLPASYGQERLWLLHQLDPTSTAYHVAGGVRLRGALDVDALRRAVNGIVARHEVLRTTFELAGGGELAQVVHPDLALDLPVVDTDRPAERGAAFVREPFDLAAGPLLRCLVLRVGPDDHHLIMVVHHIAADGWSLAVLLREAGALYQSFHSGSDVDLPELPVQYADWASWQRDQLGGPLLTEQLGYWAKRLEGVAPLELLADRPRTAPRTSRGLLTPVRVPGPTAARVRELAQELEATPFMLLLAAFVAVLSRWTGQRDVVVGVPVAGRTLPEVEALVGFFVNTLPLRVDLSGVPSFADLVGRVREVCLGGYAHADVPFEKLVEAVNADRSGGRGPLIQVMLALRDVPMPDWGGIGDLTVTPFELPVSDAQFDLSLQLSEAADGGWSGTASSSADLFDPATPAALVTAWEVLLAGAVADPDRPVSTLAIQDAGRRAYLVERLSGAGRDPVGRGLLHELFERQVDATPDAVAVVFAGTEVTYADLDRRANALAWHLRALGVGPDDLVGVCLPRSVELVVALLAVLKAGAAYVPLDPSYPRERLVFMVSDAAAGTVLTRSDALDAVAGTSARVLCLDTVDLSGESENRPPTTVTDANLAYVIYTSGSTGAPKGAMNSHGGVTNRILWMQRHFGLTPGEGVLQKTPLSFDVSGWEVHWPLATGGRMVLADPEGHRDPGYLVGLIRQQRVTTVHFVPSMLQVFLAHPGAGECAEVLRRVVCSGEELSPAGAARFAEVLPGVGLHNLYGPTEAAIDVSAHECVPGAELARVPIGLPIDGARLYVLDGHLEPCPVGVPGELFIGGVAVARGYHRRPALTAQRFVPDPFGPPSGRLYRTGDQARMRGDGAVEFLGRLDHQVKIRGVRVELGEIELALLSHPGVAEAVVTTYLDVAGRHQLAAYLTRPGQDARDEGAEEFSDQLRRHLRGKLPEAMVPAAYTIVDSFPLSPSGKLDRARLPAPERRGRSRRAVPPGTPAELVLARIWAEVLDTDDISIHDDFYDLGGNSLRAVTVLTRAHEQGFTLPAALVLGNHTISQLASAATADP